MFLFDFAHTKSCNIKPIPLMFQYTKALIAINITLSFVESKIRYVVSLDHDDLSQTKFARQDLPVQK